jgi:hypothetical protein
MFRVDHFDFVCPSVAATSKLSHPIVKLGPLVHLDVIDELFDRLLYL